MQEIYTRIKADPRFRELERKRRVFSWLMAAIVTANCFWYIGATAFFPEMAFARFWGEPILEGGSTTWGIVIGAAQTVLFIALVGLYIHRANNEFDNLKDAIVADARRAAGE